MILKTFWALCCDVAVLNLHRIYPLICDHIGAVVKDQKKYNIIAVRDPRREAKMKLVVDYFYNRHLRRERL